jgi:hypothetical protein
LKTTFLNRRRGNSPARCVRDRLVSTMSQSVPHNRRYLADEKTLIAT